MSRPGSSGWLLLLSAMLQLAAALLIVIEKNKRNNLGGGVKVFTDPGVRAGANENLLVGGWKEE